MGWQRLVAICAITTALVTGGCQKSKSDGERGSNQPSGASESGKSVASQTAVKLPELVVEVGDEKDLEAILQENRGKVVLVDFWGTWCMPCLDLLPHTLKMARDYAAQGLVVVTVAIEDIADPLKVDQVKGVLLKHGGDQVRALVSRYGIGEDSFTKFHIAGGALPCLKLYDRQGNLVVTFGVDAEKPEAQRIEAEVQRLLGQTPVSRADEEIEGPELTIPTLESSNASESRRST